jgi:Gly-Xaa carboxypeptidase
MGKEGEISLPVSSSPPAKRGSWAGKFLTAVGLSSVVYLSISALDGRMTPWTEGNELNPLVVTSCQQAEPLHPSFDTLAAINGKEGRIRDWLSGSVKIPTEMFDVMGPIGEDTRWDIFYNFSDCMTAFTF